jgi:hypothetical protein
MFALLHLNVFGISCWGPPHLDPNTFDDLANTREGKEDSCAPVIGEAPPLGLSMLGFLSERSRRDFRKLIDFGALNFGVDGIALLSLLFINEYRGRSAPGKVCL